MIWICPKCDEELLPNSNKCLICKNNHQYDRAKQGYTHLLLTSQKNSLNPGDNSSMIDARRQFLRADFYQPLVTAINNFIIKQYKPEQEITLLDLGCGEGYYLEKILQESSKNRIITTGYGIDISKVAIKKAASSAKQQQLKADYAVASSFKLPVANNSADLTLTIFAPCSIPEVKRVLKPEGVFIRVSPGPRHLHQLKQIIYEDVSLHAKPSIDPLLTLVDEFSVQFKLKLDSSNDIEKLLAMTPFSWHGKMAAKQKLIEGGKLTIEVDFIIQCCEISP